MYPSLNTSQLINATALKRTKQLNKNTNFRSIVKFHFITHLELLGDAKTVLCSSFLSPRTAKLSVKLSPAAKLFRNVSCHSMRTQFNGQFITLTTGDSSLVIHVVIRCQLKLPGDFTMILNWRWKNVWKERQIQEFVPFVASKALALSQL